jgi:hypothetical protein
MSLLMTRTRIVTRPILCLAAAGAIALLGQPAPASAKGCIKGAIVGAVAGHYAGHHAILGAAAGCAVGHHAANKPAHDQVQPSTAQPTAK